MSENSPADQQILAILAKLQDVVGDGAPRLDRDELEDVRRILKHGRTLVELARYEEAKGLFWAHWRGLILGAGAVLAALLAFWTNAEKMGIKILGLFQ